MGIFRQLSKSAHNLALDGLERIGVQLNVPHLDDDDEDEKSLLDQYFSHLKPAKPEIHYPVSEEMQAPLKDEFYPLCGSNQTIRDTIDSWFQDRKSILAEVNSELQTLENARDELMNILRHAGVIVHLPGSHAEWLSSLQQVSNIQNRNIINLLHQASRQVDDEFPDVDFDVWQSSINEKLSPFHIAVVHLGDFISISDAA
ncbi:MAG: hypothetical protein IJU23_05915 [Proteobacteria bacterium]|nr:hypothetical protein [Pseudomonadota bacterium]